MSKQEQHDDHKPMDLDDDFGFSPVHVDVEQGHNNDSASRDPESKQLLFRAPPAVSSRFPADASAVLLENRISNYGGADPVSHRPLSPARISASWGEGDGSEKKLEDNDGQDSDISKPDDEKYKPLLPEFKFEGPIGEVMRLQDAALRGFDLAIYKQRDEVQKEKNAIEDQKRGEKQKEEEAKARGCCSHFAYRVNKKYTQLKEEKFPLLLIPLLVVLFGADIGALVWTLLLTTAKFTPGFSTDDNVTWLVGQVEDTQNNVKRSLFVSLGTDVVWFGIALVVAGMVYNRLRAADTEQLRLCARKIDNLQEIVDAAIPVFQQMRNTMAEQAQESARQERVNKDSAQRLSIVEEKCGIVQSPITERKEGKGESHGGAVEARSRAGARGYRASVAAESIAAVVSRRSLGSGLFDSSSSLSGHSSSSVSSSSHPGLVISSSSNSSSSSSSSLNAPRSMRSSVTNINRSRSTSKRGGRDGLGGSESLSINNSLSGR